MNKTDPSVISVIFSTKRDKVLLIKRRDVPVWVLPGGGMEKKETPEETVIRETEEETGYLVKIKRKVGIYHPYNRLTRLTYLYECTIIGGEKKLTDETSDIQFFSLNKLPKYLPPPHDEWIKDSYQNVENILEKTLSQITYPLLLKYLCTHPILVIRFLLSRLGIKLHRRKY